MTEQQALLATILAHPKDDLPRLVYADWLEENDRMVACLACGGRAGGYQCRQCFGSGRANYGSSRRAEFIRVQIELAKREKGRRPAAYRGLKIREGQLLAGPKPHIYDNETIWFNSGDGTDTWRVLSRPVWRRGFVAEVTCPLGYWCGGECGCLAGVAHAPDCRCCPACHGTGPAVVAAHPVERVTLTDRAPVESLDIFNDPLGWSWGRSHTMAGAPTGESVNTLPAAVFDLLPTPKRHPSQAYHDSPDRDAAVDAASTALIAWAKSQPHPARITSTPLSVDLTAARLPFTYAANPDADVTFGFTTSD